MQEVSRSEQAEWWTMEGNVPSQRVGSGCLLVYENTQARCIASGGIAQTFEVCETLISKTRAVGWSVFKDASAYDCPRRCSILNRGWR